MSNKLGTESSGDPCAPCRAAPLPVVSALQVAQFSNQAVYRAKGALWSEGQVLPEHPVGTQRLSRLQCLITTTPEASNVSRAMWYCTRLIGAQHW